MRLHYGRVCVLSFKAKQKRMEDIIPPLLFEKIDRCHDYIACTSDAHGKALVFTHTLSLCKSASTTAVLPLALCIVVWCSCWPSD